MFFVNLHNLSKEISRPGVVLFVRGSYTLPHLLDDDQEITVGFGDHIPHREVRAVRRLHAGSFTQFYRAEQRVLADHANTLGEAISGLQHGFGKRKS